MDSTVQYNGALTAEQFLFPETRLVAKLYLAGKTIEEVITNVKEENLFQYPTERQVSRIARACYKRVESLGNQMLVEELATAPIRIAKQINLYAMMRSNRIVWEFMVQVIGQKFNQQDYSFRRTEMHIFYNRLGEQSDVVAGWSSSTATKIKQVLLKILVETEFLDSTRSIRLNHVYLSEELEQGVRANGDTVVLQAFHFGE